MATKVKLIADGVITPDQITLTTASTGTNTTAPATTAFVQQEISALVDSSPDALNTLNELAAALGDDANFSTTVTNSIATKLPLAGGTLTGTLNINNSSGFGNLELGGSSGGYIDFKTPFVDDHDARIMYAGSQLVISTIADQPILLKHNGSEKLRTTSTGIDITGNATFDDDGKAMFGAGSDLQIYHNGSNSFIDEVGTGILYIRAATDLRLTNADSSKLYANFEDGGASKLYHDNGLSIFTTTSGAEIREALTIGSSSNDLGTTAGNQLTPLTLRSDTSNVDSLLFTTERLADGTTWTTAAHRIQRKVDATKMGYIQFGSNADDLVTFGESETEYMRIDGSGNVGIGTISPDTIMEIRDADPVLTIRDSSTAIADANATLRLAESGASDSLGSHFDVGLGNYQVLTFGFSTDGAAATEKMRLEGSTGHLALGTNSASGRLHVNKDGTGQIIAIFSSDLGVNNRNFSILSPASDSVSEPFEFSTGNSFQFTIDGSSALRIRDDGGIAIGENNTGYAGQILSVKSGTGDLVMYGESSDASCGISLRDNSSSLNITWAAEGNDHVLKKDATVYMRVYASGDNLALGHIALESNTSGVSNTGIGTYALRENTDGSYNTAIGAVTLRDNLTGSNLTAVGYGALVTNTGSNNTGVGYKALHVTTTGENNVAVGSSALLSNTTGGNNVAIGHATLDANTTASQNVAIGATALTANTEGIGNTAVGHNALQDNTTANYNTAFGRLTLSENTTGTNNVAVGKNALLSNTEGNANVAVGRGALDANTTATNNTAVGDSALGANTTGIQNTAVGANSLDANTTGTNNVAIGKSALSADTRGARSVAIGVGALENQNFTSNTTTFNTAVGFTALQENTTGQYNTGIGYAALEANTTGEYNTALGREALKANTTAAANTGIGNQALVANTTGQYNTALGSGALLSNTTAGSNTAVGLNALVLNTEGDQNTVVGAFAADAQTTAIRTVAIGVEALTTQTTASNNTAVGHTAGASITTGGSNVIIGYNAASAATTMDTSVIIGDDAGTSITTAGNNTIIGRSAGDDLVDGGQNVIIGKLCDGGSAGASGRAVIGYNAEGYTNNSLTIGYGSTDSNIVFGATTITAPSDIRLKEDIQDEEIGLNFINDLRPVTFIWKKAKDVPQELDCYKDSEERVMNGKYNHGFIAQEVKEVIDKYNFKDGFDMWSESETDGRQRVGETSLMPLMVKAVQELSSQVDELKAEIQTLKGE